MQDSHSLLWSSFLKQSLCISIFILVWSVLSFFVCWIFYLDTNCVDVFDDILLRIFGYVSAYLDLVHLVFSGSCPWVLIYLPKDLTPNLCWMTKTIAHPNNELYSNFHTFPGDCFVFPPISAILGAFLTICFQPFAVLLFLAQCSAAPAVITSRRWNGQSLAAPFN